MGSWVEEELAYLDLGDARRNRRLVSLVTSLSEHPTESVPEAMGSWAAAKAAYRFWDSEDVAPDAIRQAHGRKAAERAAAHAEVLAIQDTTSLDLTHHPKTKGLGYLEHPKRYGLMVHSVLTASPEGVPLGLIYQKVWTRDVQQLGSRHQRRQKETSAKESQRWLTALEETQKALPEDTVVITVADREADIYEFLAAPRLPTSHLLIRATHNRRVEHQERYLWEAMRKSPVLGEWPIALHRRDTQAARTAQVTVRWQSLRVRPPRNGKGPKSGVVMVNGILVEEPSPPEGIKPLCWLLLTTLPVASLDDVRRYVRYYTYRWLIERYHFVLKSGCHVEQLQLEEAQRMHRALATYCLVAWRLLWLTYEARRDGEQSCEVAMASHEWRSLYCYMHRTATPPPTPPPLREAVFLLARLGGFLGRKGDGAPGVKVIWRGMQHLTHIVAAREIFQANLAVEDVGNA